MSQPRRSQRERSQRVLLNVSGVSSQAWEEADDVEQENVDEVESENEHSVADDSVASEDEAGWDASPKKKKKKQAKRPRANSPSRKPQKKKKRKSEDGDAAVEKVKADSQSSLFEKLSAPGTSVSRTLAFWLKQYREQSEDALNALSTFILEACGSPFDITAEDYAEESIADIVELICKQADVTVGAYPVVSKVKNMKKFKSRFREFFSKLVDAAFNQTLLEDEDFCNHLVDWLAAVSGAGLLSMRHTGSIAVFAMLSALSKLGADKKRELGVSQRLLNSKAKKKPSAAKERQQKEQVARLEEDISVIQEFAELLFSRVFVHRYRDVEHVVRTLSLECLGTWVAVWPSFFLQDSYTKYLGWCLFDRHAGVRRACLQGLLKIYSNQENVEAMKRFQLRFVPRIVEMSNDVDSRVAQSAVELLTSLLALGVLEENVGSDIPAFMWDNDPFVRKAASEFTYEESFVVDDENKDSEEKRDAEDINELIRIYKDYAPKAAEGEDTVDIILACDTLVCGLWDYLDCLRGRAWKMMVDLLLATANEKGKPTEQTLDEEEQRILAGIILASCRRAAGITVTRSGRISKEQKEKDEESRKAMIEYFVPQIGMLRVFQADAQLLRSLVQIPRCLGLEEFSTGRRKTQYVSLVKILKTIYLQHHDAVLLKEVAETLRFLCDKNCALAREGLVIVKNLATEMTDEFRELDQSTDASEFEGDALVAMQACTSRMSALLRYMHLSELKYSEEMDGLLRQLIADKGDSVIVRNLLSLHYCSLTWKWSSLSTSEEPSSLQMSQFTNEQDNLVSHLEGAFEMKDEKVQEDAFTISADLFVTYSLLSLGQRPALKPAILEPGKLHNQFREYFLKLVEVVDANDAETARKVVLAFGCAARVVASSYPLHKELAAHFLSCFLQFSKDIDSIIKATMAKLRHNVNDTILLDAQYRTLVKLYEAGEEQRVTEVASRFALSFPMDTSKRSFLPFFAKAVEYAMTDYPNNTSFLGVAMTPYTSRASKQDLLKALERLEDREANVVEGDETDAHVDEMVALMEKRLGKEVSRVVDQSTLRTPNKSRRKSKASRRNTRSPGSALNLADELSDDDIVMSVGTPMSSGKKRGRSPGSSQKKPKWRSKIIKSSAKKSSAKPAAPRSAKRKRRFA